MEIFNEAMKFQNLCIKYRKAYADSKMKDAEKLQCEIKALVNAQIDRLRVSFNLKMEKQCTKLSKKHGIPLIALSIPKIMNGEKNLATLDFNQKKPVDGVNLLLDYSGSMWFDSSETINGVKRIYGQNFIALCIAGLVSKISPNSYVRITAFCRSPINVLDTNGIDFDMVDWDGLLVHSKWGSGLEETGYGNIELMPVVLRGCDVYWFCSEYPQEALEDSIKSFKRFNKINRFINLFITDGGMHRLGESKIDHDHFLSKMMVSMIGMSNFVSSSFIFIKQQSTSSEKICKAFGIDYATINQKEELDKAFLHLTSILNNRMR